MDKIRLAVVGLGGRGTWWLGELLKMDDVEVTSVCDLHADRMENGRKMCAEKYGHEIFGSTDYREIVGRPDNVAVFIPTYWNDHIKVAIAAMKAGKYAASEVGPCQSVQQCWDLVRTSEETGMPYMMMENCCYDKDEMTVLNMIKKGMFGELIHCEGGYQHDLRGTLVRAFESDHERCWQNWHRNAELYPTHELGPIMTYLGINRGNRMLTLTSTASKARGCKAYAEANGISAPEYHEGDVVKTEIRCANGETITLTHDVSLPHPYSRLGIVKGTKGMWSEDKHAVYFDGISPSETWEPIEKYYEDYGHPLWKKTGADDFTGGHGGMDWLVMRGFLEAVKNGTETPIDVYDSAAMMVVSVLSEDSIAMGGAPVAIPDFTDGRWVKREPGPKTIFSLWDLDESLFN